MSTNAMLGFDDERAGGTVLQYLMNSYVQD